MTRNLSTVLALSLLASTSIGVAQWGPQERLSNTDSASVVNGIVNPLLAVGDTLLATWQDYAGGKSCIVHRRSTDNGASWSFGGPLTACLPVRAAFMHGSGRTICLAYDSAGSLMFRRSTNNGMTWGASDTLARWPDRGVVGVNRDGYAQFAWEDNETLYCRQSTDNGASWSADTALRAVDSYCELLAMVSERAPDAYLVFSSYDSLLVAGTTDNGATWLPARSVVTASDIRREFVDVDDQGRIHIMWADSHTGNPEVYYRRSTDNGNSWSPSTRFTISDGSDPYWIDAKDTNVYVSYGNLSTGKNRRRSFDGGASWEDESRWPGDYPPGHYYASVHVGEQNWLHCITMGYGTGYRVEYYRSKDAGTTWQDSAIVISDEDLLYRYPREVATAGGSVHVLWEDYQYGNYDIMYRRGQDLAGIEEEPGFKVDPSAPPLLFAVGPLVLPGTSPAVLYDGTGRLTAQLSPGRNDISSLSPGVYFLRSSEAGSVVGAKVMVGR